MEEGVEGGDVGGVVGSDVEAERGVAGIVDEVMIVICIRINEDEIMKGG